MLDSNWIWCPICGRKTRLKNRKRVEGQR
ncbi:cysteine-rich KTR domain-containing protein [Faecalimonas umbilicata]|nr:cysteine-rich KTR domain-containing protein [Faecalimonas umbilicata]